MCVLCFSMIALACRVYFHPPPQCQLWLQKPQSWLQRKTGSLHFPLWLSGSFSLLEKWNQVLMIVSWTVSEQGKCVLLKPCQQQVHACAMPIWHDHTIGHSQWINFLLINHPALWPQLCSWPHLKLKLNPLSYPVADGHCAHYAIVLIIKYY